MECADCRHPDAESHHDHDGVCCSCYEEAMGRPRKQPRPIVKPAALLVRNGKLLVARSKGKSLFYAVGGKLEAGETDEECLHREVLEEIGCQITSQTYYRTFFGPSSDGSKSVVMICFFVTLAQEPQASSEIDELLWADSSTPKEILGSMIRDFVIPALKEENLLS